METWTTPAIRRRDERDHPHEFQDFRAARYRIGTGISRVAAGSSTPLLFSGDSITPTFIGAGFGRDGSSDRRHMQAENR